ncbi:hypothetical protein ACTFIU_011149 [Dictyostelium citrinum]
MFSPCNLFSVVQEPPAGLVKWSTVRTSWKPIIRIAHGDLRTKQLYCCWLKRSVHAESIPDDHCTSVHSSSQGHLVLPTSFKSHSVLNSIILVSILKDASVQRN